MTAKLDPFASEGELMRSWTRLSLQVSESLGSPLAELVEIRASQLNGCANCLNMHTAAARAKGETEQRINLVSAWWDAPCYTEREQAALAWTDAMTRLSHHPEHDTAYARLKAHYSEAERVQLTLMINMINGWNRIAVGFGIFMEDPTSVPADAVA
ncbi:MAG: carboxymuconolactone decarboxylase family protein [Alphaproteobacteria bacterium]|uniref:carboxymuconolactone decarboxylase family protein n=1 Tax=Maricaulis alexandrii TaxID=2570354 RepID=UPI001107FA36|nr:carboxymuconolactone decarboxylase family protein [Maricaulis alexandrii]MCR9267927.1 carboxymuconolactone decarboxylase family protein [Alphaproteobacteria bacterium]